MQTDNDIFGYSLEEILAYQQGHCPKKLIRRTPGQDHGADPLGNGQFKMIPSGDIVDLAERNRRLAK